MTYLNHEQTLRGIDAVEMNRIVHTARRLRAEHTTALFKGLWARLSRRPTTKFGSGRGMRHA